MRARFKDKPHSGAACVIIQQQDCTHRATDPVSMPALPSLSLLSTAVSGLIYVAGQAVDALQSAQSSSSKKNDSSDQKQDGDQLVNVFAAYLAAAAALPASAQRQQGQSSLQAQQAGSGASLKSGKNGSTTAAPLPLSVILAAGPTNAITAAVALRCVSTKANALSLKNTAAPSHVPGAAPIAKQFTASDTKSNPSAKGMQNTVNGGLRPSVPSAALPATVPETTAQVPVLALHDVPVSNPQDNVLPAVVSNAPSSGEHPALVNGLSQNQPAVAERMSLEAQSVSGLLWQGQTAKSDSTKWSGMPGLITTLQVAKSGSVSHSVATDDSQNLPTQIGETSSARSDPNQLVSASGSIGQLAPNTTTNAPSSSQTETTLVAQLSHALITQAAVVNREGRTDFHLRLEPPQLGSVQIHLTATDHTVSARVVVAQEGTRQLIEGQAHQLRQALADSGVVLGSFDVTRDGGGLSQGGHHQQPELPAPAAENPRQNAVSRVTQTVATRPSQNDSSTGIDILA